MLFFVKLLRYFNNFSIFYSIQFSYYYHHYIFHLGPLWKRLLFKVCGSSEVSDQGSPEEPTDQRTPEQLAKESAEFLKEDRQKKKYEFFLYRFKLI